jgi:hypothetical protein
MKRLIDTLQHNALAVAQTDKQRRKRRGIKPNEGVNGAVHVERDVANAAQARP